MCVLLFQNYFKLDIASFNRAKKAAGVLATKPSGKLTTPNRYLMYIGYYFDAEYIIFIQMIFYDFRYTDSNYILSKMVKTIQFKFYKNNYANYVCYLLSNKKSK